MESKFLPLQWVIFKNGVGHGFGQIDGASEAGDGKGWTYYISNAAGERHYTIQEDDVVRLLSNGVWATV
jgi:hypothetical protein